MGIDLKQIAVGPVGVGEEPRYRELMGQHHTLGDLAKTGHTLWYVATYQEEWIALLTFSGSALKCAARDRWIGWDYRHQYGRLKLIANNSRFLILPDWHCPNLGSKVLALCERRIDTDWLAHFDQHVLLLETFVDSARYRGTVYRAANWSCVGQTQGSRRIQGGYSARDGSPKLIFVRPLRRDAQWQLSRPILNVNYLQEAPKIMLAIEHMCALPTYFKDIPDPRRTQGRRHPFLSCSPLPRGPPFAEWMATRRSPAGPKIWAPRPANASVAGLRTGNGPCPAKALFATCSCGSIPTRSTAHWSSTPNQRFTQTDMAGLVQKSKQRCRQSSISTISSPASNSAITLSKRCNTTS